MEFQRKNDRLEDKKIHKLFFISFIINETNVLK